MTETARGPTLKAAVQTSPDLSVWTTRPDLAFEEYREGQSEIVGHARMRLDWGLVAEDGLAPGTVADAPELAGLYVRILRQNDATGTVTIGATKYDPVWWGRMLTPDASAQGGSGTTTYQAAGIAVVLQDRTCWLGRAIVKTGPVVFSLDFNLRPFNHWPSGDRSAAAGTVGGVNVYLHDATATSTGNLWTAGQILNYLFACNFKYEHPPSPSGSGQLGLNWSISDPDGCLDYEPHEYDARGKTLTQVLNDLAGRRRGMTWWVTVSGAATIVVHVASGLLSAITVGTETIPANTAVWDQLDDTDPFIYPVGVRIVQDEVADEIVVRGSPRRIGITLGIYGSGTPWASDSASQLVKGWTDAAETACNTFLDGGSTAGRRSAAYEHAWRRFELRTTNWTGSQYGGGGMPDFLPTVTNSSYGTAGYDGTASRIGGSTLAGLWYSADGNLPCAPGFTALNVGPRQPLVIVAEDDAAGTWHDHTSDWTVWVESSPPAVIIDDGSDGAVIRDILRNGRKILVSLTLVDFLPFQVMWRRNPAQWLTVPPRIKNIDVPDMTQEYLLAGMVTGVSSEAGGSLLTTASQITTRDNVVQLRALLAHARAFYEDPYAQASFTDRGVWDINPAYGPGTILGVITDGTDPREVNALVTSRTVRLETAKGEGDVEVRYWSTSWETDVLYPDLEAVL